MCLRLLTPKQIPAWVNGKLTCYKLVYPLRTSYVTAFMDVETYVPGWLTSGRTKSLCSDEIERGIVDIGIHVFLHKKEAFTEKERLKQSGMPSFSNLVVVECEAFENDLVTFGINAISTSPRLYTDGAVFLKVHLLKVIEEGE